MPNHELNFIIERLPTDNELEAMTKEELIKLVVQIRNVGKQSGGGPKSFIR